MFPVRGVQNKNSFISNNKIRPSAGNTGADRNYTGSTDIILLKQVNYIILPAKTQVPGIFIPCCQ